MLRALRSFAVLAVVAVITSAAVAGWASSVSASPKVPQMVDTDPPPKPEPKVEEWRFSAGITGPSKPGSPSVSGQVVELTDEERSVLENNRKMCAALAAMPVESVNQETYREFCVSRAGDPATAARQVVAEMDLHVPAMGLAPRPTTVDPDSVGLVGVPNYMWVDNPEIFETVSDSAAIDAWTITVSGKVEWVDWDMGDGQVIRCKGPGTPYQARFDLNPSPDCGHVYSVQGTHTVRATAHWVLHWSGGGQSGTVTTDRSASAPVVIGEAFALRRV